MDSGMIEEQLTRSLQQGTYKRNAKNKMWTPSLFSMMFSAMLTNAFHDCDDGSPTMPIRHRFDGKLFNLLYMRHRLEGGFSHITTLWNTLTQIISYDYLVFHLS